MSAVRAQAVVVIAVFSFCLLAQERRQPMPRTGSPYPATPQPRYVTPAPDSLNAGVKDIEVIDVLILKNGTKFAQTRISGGQPFRGTLPAGEYVVVMSWSSPVVSSTPDGAQLKSFFESRSNVSNVAAPGWQVTPEADDAFAPGEWAQFERWPYAYAIAGQGVRKGKGYIEQKGNRIELVQEIVIDGASANVRGLVRRAKKPPAATVSDLDRRIPPGGFTNAGTRFESPYSVTMPEQPAATAKDIDGIDVIIVRKPKGNKVAQFRLTGGQPLDTRFPAGEYVMVMSWSSPVRSTTPDGAQLKSFFESRSNVSNIAASGWQVTPGAEAGFVPTEWRQFERWPYAYAISGENVREGNGFIEQKGDRVELVQEIVVLSDTNVRANVRRATRAPEGPVTQNPADVSRPVN